MFHNVIKTHHDGIMITSDDQIIFNNRQVLQIFTGDIELEQPQFETSSLNSNFDLKKQLEESEVENENLKMININNAWDCIRVNSYQIQSQQQQELKIDGEYVSYSYEKKKSYSNFSLSEGTQHETKQL